MKNPTVTVFGGGQMGRALVGGMIVSGSTAADQTTLVDPNQATRDWWGENHPAVATAPDAAAIERLGEVILLAVKPKIIADVAAQLRELDSASRLVVSIAAGISLESLCEACGHQRVIRVMPNTPSLVGAGASAYCVAGDVTQEECEWIEAALSGVGLVVSVDESQMDAVTGLSGSGPAYLCLVIEALADGGVLAGLPRALALRLAAQTVYGTAKMVMETGQHPGELKDAVASPGGTTIAAIRVLEERGLRASLIDAVKASADRSKDLA